MINILIVEDNLEINNLIKETLGRAGYTCTQAFSGTEGFLNIKTKEYSLTILDLILPGMTGEEFIKQTRKIKDCPILVVSAKKSIESIVDCLDCGADDYLVKPFDIKELKARVDALIRRTSGRVKKNDIIKFNGIELDNDLFDIKIDGKLLNLTNQEFKIIRLLMKNSSKVFTKQDIYEYAWDDYYMGEDKTINVHVSNIRKKIKEFIDEDIIETVWGIGFKLKK